MSARPPATPPDNARSRRRMWAAMGVATFVMVIELVGGLASGSLALLADAGHMFTDVLGLLLSLAAMTFAQRPPSGRHTWGYRRLEPLAALVNGVTLMGIALWVGFTALVRLPTTPQIDVETMMQVSVGGLVANVTGLVLLSHPRGNVNVRSAFLHVAADALGALGVLASAAIIGLTGWVRADAVVSCLIAALIFATSLRLIREVLTILMEAAPSAAQLGALEAALQQVAGVAAVEGLRVWSLTSNCTAVSAQLRLAAGVTDPLAVTDAGAAVARQLGAHHVTLQACRP